LVLAKDDGAIAVPCWMLSAKEQVDGSRGVWLELGRLSLAAKCGTLRTIQTSDASMGLSQTDSGIVGQRQSKFDLADCAVPL
jgi:hypothetical protein